MTPVAPLDPAVPRYDPDHLRRSVRLALRAAGVPDAIAAVEAEVMVDADLCGVPSHGIVMLPKLLAALRDGRAAADPSTAVRRDRGAACLFDAGNGPGRWSSIVAMDLAIERARTYGIGLCVAVRTTHWGRAYAYAAHAARAGCVGVCFTNAMPTLAPEGATRALVGNNPVAIGIPPQPGEAPIVLDMAMTQAALGKVATWRREGREVPPGWGFDAAGRPSTDAGAILASGLLAPVGGHKGFGLALMAELLTAGLGGGPFGHEIAGADPSGVDPDSSKCFLAIETTTDGIGATLAPRSRALLDWMKAAAPDAGVQAPGDQSAAAHAANLRDGVPVHPGIVAQLTQAGVTVPAVRSTTAPAPTGA